MGSREIEETGGFIRVPGLHSLAGPETPWEPWPQFFKGGMSLCAG